MIFERNIELNNYLVYECTDVEVRHVFAEHVACLCSEVKDILFQGEHGIGDMILVDVNDGRQLVGVANEHADHELREVVRVQLLVGHDRVLVDFLHELLRGIVLVHARVVRNRG